MAAETLVWFMLGERRRMPAGAIKVMGITGFEWARSSVRGKSSTIIRRRGRDWWDVEVRFV